MTRRIQTAAGSNKTRRCPLCDMPASGDHGAFCSARCRNLDLANWLNGDYRIPVIDDDRDQDVADPDSPPMASHRLH